jgi:hypothetical protein
MCLNRAPEGRRRWKARVKTCLNEDERLKPRAVLKRSRFSRRETEGRASWAKSDTKRGVFRGQRSQIPIDILERGKGIRPRVERVHKGLDA